MKDYFDLPSMPNPDFRLRLAEPYFPGSTYDLHPEHTRSGAAYIARALGKKVVPSFVIYDTVYYGTHLITGLFDREVVSKAPEAEQQGLWQMFAAGLTGSPMGGNIKF
jgi:hypothetical protein